MYYPDGEHRTFTLSEISHAPLKPLIMADRSGIISTITTDDGHVLAHVVPPTEPEPEPETGVDAELDNDGEED